MSTFPQMILAGRMAIAAAAAAAAGTVVVAAVVLG
jgi:hypothetical protein